MAPGVEERWEKKLSTPMRKSRAIEIRHTSARSVVTRHDAQDTVKEALEHAFHHLTRPFERLGKKGREVVAASDGNCVDVKLWDDLPFCLQDFILSSLPPYILFRNRYLNKQWFQAFETSFRDSPSPGQLHLVRGATGDIQKCAVFDFSSCQWSELISGFPPPFKFIPQAAVVASAGGLLCLRGSKGRFSICNPLIGTCFRLPRMVQGIAYVPIMAMTVDKQAKSYKVIAVSEGRDFDEFVVQVYNSVTKAWVVSTTNKVPWSHFFKSNIVCINDSIYMCDHKDKGSILTYDVSEGRTHFRQGDQIDVKAATFSKLSQCQGRLLLMGVVQEAGTDQSLTPGMLSIPVARVVIWELRQNRWIQVACLQGELLETLPTMSESDTVECSEEKDFVCFNFSTIKTLAYAVSTRSWWWLPKCPYVQWEGFNPRWEFQYEPDFGAPVN